jgi:acetyl-CoA acetyltransferase
VKLDVTVAGVGMTPFGKHRDRSLKSLASEAIIAALEDAGLGPRDIQAAYMGNAGAALITGQVCVTGEVMLREMGIGGIPVLNIENACATASSAMLQAAAMVSFGAYDVVLACGYEKLTHEDKSRTFAVFSGAVDVDSMSRLRSTIDARLRAVGMEPGADGSAERSLFLDIYATEALTHMQKYGTTREQLAAVPAKNSRHGSLNSRAQYREVLSVEDVLTAREIVYPLTLPMCSPIGDGAAAAILVSKRKARQLQLRKQVNIRSCVLQTSWDYAPGEESAVFRKTIDTAYQEAEAGAEDLDVIELHDASASSEILHTEYLGLCAPGEGGPLVQSGATALGGRIPVNPSGGLLRKGHPIGATGIAQIVELTEQLRQRSGTRQVADAQVALAENGGGYINGDVAALVVTILSR